MARQPNDLGNLILKKDLEEDRSLRVKKPELLSPAGSMEHYRAAVENGADGIYFGGKSFNARQSAQNFSFDEMKEAIAYGSLRNVKSYLTVNTLIRDNELSKAVNQVEEGMQAGIAGFIVQDLGLADILKKTFPQIRLHLSTQGTIYNKEGASFAERFGFKRVVLAREMSEIAIKDIVRNTNIETEIFVHGALCVCYSGQCMMSSMIGERSGNRGSCAQPCRLLYDLTLGNEEVSKGYLLSPKDICLLTELKKVIALGVTSLKIEGRMKSPEYTAIVTRTYRNYLDEIFETLQREATPYKKLDRHQGKSRKVGNGEKEKKGLEEDLERLSQVFNRGGFTKGYFVKKYNGGLLSGNSPKHRGLYLGKVESVKASLKIKGKQIVEVKLHKNLSMGDGIEFLPRNVQKGSSDLRNGYFNSNTENRKQTETPAGGVISHIKGKDGSLKGADSGETVWIGDFSGQIYLGDMVYKITDSLLLKEIRETYRRDNNRKSNVYGHFVAKKERPVVFTLWDDYGTLVKATLETENEDTDRKCPEEGLKTDKQKTGREGDAGLRQLSEERILAQLSKTGNTPFQLASCEIEIDGHCILTVSQINGLRRKAFEYLMEEKKRVDE